MWLAAFLWVRPSPFEPVWAKFLLLLAPLVLVPLGLRLITGLSKDNPWLGKLEVFQLPAALLLGGALSQQPGWPAAALAFPWLTLTVILALSQLVWLWQHRASMALYEITSRSALMFLPVGGVWAVSDRLGFRPLDFEPVIVLLTAIHFHYAGFVLPLLTSFAMRQGNGAVGRVAAVAVVSGVPLVAAGITTTQLKLGWWLECIAAAWLGFGGILLAWLQAQLITRMQFPFVSRVLWMISAGSLFFSMFLAILYGTRFYLPLSWLDIAWMRALHGTANAVGFGGAGLLAWTIAGSSPQES
ncbi:MAG: YndJ family transporter [Acidobacteriota bacterium]